MNHYHRVTVTNDSVSIDGKRLHGVRSVAVEVEAQAVANVTLELEIVDVIYNGDADVTVGVSQTETLMALGWTPPK
jgi:hypothetical protein